MYQLSTAVQQVTPRLSGSNNTNNSKRLSALTVPAGQELGRGPVGPSWLGTSQEVTVRCGLSLGGLAGAKDVPPRRLGRFLPASASPQGHLLPAQHGSGPQGAAGRPFQKLRRLC